MKWKSAAFRQWNGYKFHRRHLIRQLLRVTNKRHANYLSWRGDRQLWFGMLSDMIAVISPLPYVGVFSSR